MEDGPKPRCFSFFWVFNLAAVAQELETFFTAFSGTLAGSSLDLNWHPNEMSALQIRIKPTAPQWQFQNFCVFNKEAIFIFTLTH